MSKRFKFKHFDVEHYKSSMRIGVDGVLVGAWCRLDGARSVLDIGTGCGVIALMAAQRCDADICAIDVDAASIEEAKGNVERSEWEKRIECRNVDFNSFVNECISSKRKFDCIVSNPPYYACGVDSNGSRRMAARHQGDLSPYIILDRCSEIIDAGGRLVMILPSEVADKAEEETSTESWTVSKKCRVRGHNDAPYKRTLIEFLPCTSGDCHERNHDYEEETLTLEVSPGIPTPEYRRLCKDFYLKF